jgi:hypothetical protein
MRSLLSLYATALFTSLVIVLFIVGTVRAFSHSNFFSSREVMMSPKTAVRLGLLSETDAPWAGGLVFKKNDMGGFDYREGRGLSFLTSTRSTDLDVPAECERVGGCDVRIPPR